MIIHVVPWAGSNRGGVEVSVSQLAAWQREAGVNVEILTFEAAGLTSFVVADLRGVPIRRQNWYGADVQERGWRGRLSVMWHRRELRAALRAAGCHVVHFHYLDPAYTTAGAVCKELGIPYTITFHGSDRFELASHWNWYGDIVRDATQLFAVSSATAAEVVGFLAERLGLDRPPVRVVRQGIKVETMDSCPLEQRSGVLFVGSLTPVKNPDLFCGAMELVRHVHPSCPAIIVGTGALEMGLREAYPWAEFRGRLSSEEVSRCMGQARALCITSRSEGLPRVAVEAHGLGTPIVSTKVGGIADIVADGETGFLHHDPDAAGLSASLCRLLEDDTLWAAMSQEARARAETLHNPTHFVQAYGTLQAE